MRASASDFPTNTAYGPGRFKENGDQCNKLGIRNPLKVKDKAISVGENSSIKVSNDDFQDIGVGIANKDGSDTTAKNCNIRKLKDLEILTEILKSNSGC